MLWFRYDLLKAHVEEIAKNNKQDIRKTSEKAASKVLVAIENGKEKESNNEERGSVDDAINHKSTTEIQNNEKNTKVGQISLVILERFINI